MPCELADYNASTYAQGTISTRPVLYQVELHMTERARRIELAAQKLAVAERERLAERLLTGLGSETLSDIEEKWVREAERRYRRWKKDRSRSLPAAKMLRELRKELLQ